MCMCIYIWGLYMFMNIYGELKWIYPIRFRCFRKNRLTMKHEDLSMGKCEE